MEDESLGGRPTANGDSNVRDDKFEKGSTQSGPAMSRRRVLASGVAAPIVAGAASSTSGARTDHLHEYSHVPSDSALAVMALEALLTDKGIIRPDTVGTIADYLANQIGPQNGARVVAKAWSDPHFLTWLAEDATSAIASLGFGGTQAEHMQVAVNTVDTHNIIVCTLCSCYPWAILGLPPAWYKSDAYRARVVIDPRAVLSEFGEDVGEEISIRVWDSTSELRYMVIPQRPAGTESWSEEQLAAIVTRNSMIGMQRQLALMPAREGGGNVPA